MTQTEKKTKFVKPNFSRSANNALKNKERNLALQRRIFSTLSMRLVNFQKQPPEVLYKKVFLEILQNSQEISCVRVFF